MTNRERALAVLNYEPYDRLPVVHFGFLEATLQKWVAEEHLSPDEIDGVGDSNDAEQRLAAKLGFDFNWQNMVGANAGLRPHFETRVIEQRPDGTVKSLTGEGTVVLTKPGLSSIPAQMDYLLKGRREWEELYRPKLQFVPERVPRARLEELRDADARQNPVGLHCGSLYGLIRNFLTVEGSCYLYADDEAVFTEIVDTVGELCFRGVEAVLKTGAQFDFAHFWEDICFKNGPLISPKVFAEKVGPHYRRITDLLHQHGIEIVSLDCDGKIDALVPTWFENGVNTMFPIEVGTWSASVAPWRRQYGRGLLGVGGMDKRVLARDRAAVDAEIERLKPLVALGGYLPCPDHRLPGDVEWDNVRYYCERMRSVFG